MACLRCGGLLVREHHFDIQELSALEPVECQRCLNCGAIEDPVIQANRVHLSETRRPRSPRGPRPLSQSRGKSMEPEQAAVTPGL